MVVTFHIENIILLLWMSLVRFFLSAYIMNLRIYCDILSLGSEFSTEHLLLRFRPERQANYRKIPFISAATAARNIKLGSKIYLYCDVPTSIIALSIS